MELTPEDWAALRPHTFAYLDAEDEILPSPLIYDFFQSQGVYAKMFDGGDHRFQHMPEAIEDFLTQISA